jgi:hypothetical protein
MRVKYTPGTPEGLVGKTYNVEVIGIRMHDVPFVTYPIVKSVMIKYEDGETEWVEGYKFYSSIVDTATIIRYSH